jgi:hypothetical protein
MKKWDFRSALFRISPMRSDGGPSEIAIILPAFILFAGAGFFWAFRGFQDR